MFKNRSKLLFASAVVSTIYIVYLITYLGMMMSSSSNAAAVIGGAIATALLTPHMLIIGLGAVFAWIGFGTKQTWGALVAAILYCAGALVFLLYAMFSIPLIILGFLGYANQKKINSNV
ncbi:MAG: hypothetical protein PHQ89_02315 [Bacilli bacterium]|nr:hypothetical protein [Bacilli bacterium]